MRFMFLFFYIFYNIGSNTNHFRNVEGRGNILKSKNRFQKCLDDEGNVYGSVKIHGDVIQQIDIDWRYLKGIEVMDTCTYNIGIDSFVVGFGVSESRWKLEGLQSIKFHGKLYPNYDTTVSLRCSYSGPNDKQFVCTFQYFRVIEKHWNLAVEEVRKREGECLFHAWPDSNGKVWYNHRTIAGLTCLVKADFFDGTFKSMRWTFNGIEIVIPKDVELKYPPTVSQIDINNLEESENKFTSNENYEETSRTTLKLYKIRKSRKRSHILVQIEENPDLTQQVVRSTTDENAPTLKNIPFFEYIMEDQIMLTTQTKQSDAAETITTEKHEMSTVRDEKQNIDYTALDEKITTKVEKENTDYNTAIDEGYITTKEDQNTETTILDIDKQTKNNQRKHNEIDITYDYANIEPHVTQVSDRRTWETFKFTYNNQRKTFMFTYNNPRRYNTIVNTFDSSSSTTEEDDEWYKKLYLYMNKKYIEFSDQKNYEDNKAYYIIAIVIFVVIALFICIYVNAKGAAKVVYGVKTMFNFKFTKEYNCEEYDSKSN